MSAHVAQNCNAHTAGIYRGSLENHILPALGMMPLGLVERAHVSALHYRLRETPRAANRALAVLSKMFSLAAAWGLVPDGTTPAAPSANTRSESASASSPARSTGA